MDEPQLFLMLVAAARTSDAAMRPAGVAAIVHEALARGGRLRETALGQYFMRDFGWMTDAELQAAVRDLYGSAPVRWEAREYNREAALCEIVRRARRPGDDAAAAAWERTLSDEHRRFHQAAAGATDVVVDLWRERSDLEVITALRRVQGKADPLRVEVLRPAAAKVDEATAGGAPDAQAVFPSLPEFHVALANRDAGRESIAFTEGGGSSRIMITDADGSNIRTVGHLLQFPTPGFSGAWNPLNPIGDDSNGSGASLPSAVALIAIAAVALGIAVIIRRVAASRL